MRLEVRAIQVSGVELLDVRQGFLLGVSIIHSNKDHPLIHIFSPRHLQVSSLFPAGQAPGSPKVNDHHLAAQFTQSDRLPIEAGQAKIRS